MPRRIFHSLLLIVLYQDVVYPIAPNCLFHESCSCRNTDENTRWEVFCSVPEAINLTVSVDPNFELGTVYCHDMDTWPFDEIKMSMFTGKKFIVKFHHCPLPEWPLINIIGNEDNENMYRFEIGGVTSTKSKLTRRNFLKFPKISVLLLYSSEVLQFSADAFQDLSDLERIVFSKNEFSDLPRGLFAGLPKLTSLSLIGNKMQRVDSLPFQNLSQIKWMSLSDNHLRSLHPRTFKDLVNLMNLDIANNYLTTLPEDIFKPLKLLYELRLSGNDFFWLPQRLLIGNRGLVKVHLSENRGNLTTLPGEFFGNLPSLTFAYLSENNFTELPEDVFVGTPGIKLVDLSRNKLSKLEDGLSENLTLVIIDLQNNAITSISRNLLSGFSHLQTLRFDSNQISEIEPWSFSNFKYLRTVSLRKNKLASLPENIFWGSFHLKLLDLSDNRLTHLPEKLFKNSTSLALVNIHLQNNAITSISRNLLSDLSDLQTLRFDSNQISEIESWSFSNFKYLRTVFLRKNKLASLPENIFWGSFHLKSLDLSDNRLTHLPEKLFKDSTSLVDLRLNANNLKNLPDSIFGGLDNLLKLNLQNNAFTTLPDKVLAQATSLQNLNLAFNRMTEINPSRLLCLPSLKVACFSHNSINRIVPKLIPDAELLQCIVMPKLTDLALDHNHIDNFLWHEMDVFENLSLLNLTGNRLSSVELPIGGIIGRQVTIDLTRNNLTKLVPIDNIPLNSKLRLYIGDNQIDCGCDFHQLRKYLVDESRFKFNKVYAVTPDHLTCRQPVSMLERRVENLEMETFECKLHDSDKPRVCRGDCYCTWRASDDTLVVTCSYRHLTTAPYNFDGFKGSAIELNLTSNSITEMPFFHKDSWREYKWEKVRKIILSYNRISNVTFDVFPRNLRVLHLDNNHLTRFHVAVAEAVRSTTSLQELALHSNPWSCDRETRESFAILEDKVDRKIGHAFGKSCLDYRHNKNGDKQPTSYITYQMF